MKYLKEILKANAAPFQNDAVFALRKTKGLAQKRKRLHIDNAEVSFVLEAFEALIKPLMMLLSFVSGGNAFPKPLSAAEEREYLEKYEKGDIEARNKLIEHNLRLVAHVVKKYSASGYDSEDLISIGTIGLIKGISSFNSSKGTRLATYAARCVENELLMLMRSRKKTRGEISLSDPIGTDKEGNQIYLMDVLSSDGGEIFDEIQNRDDIKKLYENIQTKLSKREKYIITERYGLSGGECRTQSEIAKKLGISRSYVSRIEKKAVSKLKDGIN